MTAAVSRPGEPPTIQAPDGPVGQESLERCALRSQLRGDPMLGTAFPAARVLLVEQPGPWGHGGLRDSQFDGAIARRLEAELGRQGIRVLAIRNPGRPRPVVARRWGFADCRPGHEQLVWGTFGRDEELLTLNVAADIPHTAMSQGTVDDLPNYLVCAHSKHDVCCALRGRPVAAGLDESRPGRVWECTHVGGERFAANVLVLPLGLLYGRVPAFIASRFPAAIERGEVMAPYLRGRVGFTQAAQAAFAFAHILFEVAHIGAIEVLGTREVSPAETVVRLRAPEGVFSVSVAVERSDPALLTCQATAAKTFLVYRPVAFTRE